MAEEITEEQIAQELMETAAEITDLIVEKYRPTGLHPLRITTATFIVAKRMLRALGDHNLAFSLATELQMDVLERMRGEEEDDDDGE